MQNFNSDGTKLNKANVLGIGIHAITLSTACDVIETAIEHHLKGYICVTDVNSVMHAQRDRSYREVLKGAMLVTPDGMPNVWIGRLQGHDRMARVCGRDLMLEVCGRSIRKGYGHFIYGGKPGIAGELASRLKSIFPDLNIAGCYTPPFGNLSENEERELIATVKRIKPQIFWVGLGCPKQERMMAEYVNKLDINLMIGVGAAFDYHTGRLKSPPGWICQSGLEWLYRLCQEPRRLSRRYLINNPQFIYKVTMQLTGLRKYEIDNN